MRYRLTYLHLPTRARLAFTLECPGLEGAARGAGGLWLHESGADPQEFAFLSVVRLAGLPRLTPECNCAMASECESGCRALREGRYMLL